MVKTTKAKKVQKPRATSSPWLAKVKKEYEELKRRNISKADLQRAGVPNLYGLAMKRAAAK